MKNRFGRVWCYPVEWCSAEFRVSGLGFGRILARFLFLANITGRPIKKERVKLCSYAVMIDFRLKGRQCPENFRFGGYSDFVFPGFVHH